MTQRVAGCLLDDVEDGIGEIVAQLIGNEIDGHFDIGRVRFGQLLDELGHLDLEVTRVRGRLREG